MGRLLIVANRLPVRVTKSSTKRRDIRLNVSPGGLVAGLSCMPKSCKCSWIGWPGITAEKLTAQEKEMMTDELAARDYAPIFLSEKEFENYYEGFSNKTIWPLFHYFPLHTIYENPFWQAYKRVNQIFCEEIVKLVKPDDRIWIHDYHLMLLPQLIRRELKEVEIGFFLHIPFPSFELFRLLPWRAEILNGLLGADLIGFHTYDYVRHFLSSVCRIAGLEHTLGKLSVDNRLVKIDAFPLGIDYEKYSNAPNKPAVQQEVERIRRKVGDRKIVISVDRLDYTKGIVKRLEAFDLFLSENPAYKGKVTLIIVAVPSRTTVRDYVALRKSLEQLVGRVNGAHGTLGWMPVWYLYRSLPFEKLTALYHIADVALVTPLRDGMNLIAKEFIATKTDGKGVLILSEMTGAASELGEAIIVNANNKAEIIQAIKDALEMPHQEQVERNRLMQSRLSRYNVSRWSTEFLTALSDVAKTQQELAVRKLSEPAKQNLISSYRKSNKRLFLFDYDGTLVSFRPRPEKAGPERQLLDLLHRLSENSQNEVVIISGRDKTTLARWLGSLKLSLIAEHGAWIKEKDKDWQSVKPVASNWKDVIRPILELYADRTPGSLVEEKDFSLTWHFRQADPELARARTQEIRGALLNLTENLNVGVIEGNKVLEVKHLDINKGHAVLTWLAKLKWDFVMAAGDDYTDEDMFAVLPRQAYSIKVGLSISKAKFNVNSIHDLRSLLHELIGE